ncbi:MAG: Polyketide biosynthesis acyl-carrier-protein AcpK [Luteibacter sp.]|uniref:acyl carrier protein n=1 Tax=Luteibacter sp. TaxID=1886636 RepID=UPI001382A6E3|nr:acyl carrier protein [Luteibacter sp.]KAF1007420.1 MAG: Polyketide biosynthesis acyl-carrier-protein AcpK [Luteibacter sp.]
MNKDDILELIIKHAREVLPSLDDRALAGTDSLRDLGANSMDRSEIVMMTLETLDIDMPLAETIKASNMGELAALLADRKAGTPA